MDVDSSTDASPLRAKERRLSSEVQVPSSIHSNGLNRSETEPEIGDYDEPTPSKRRRLRRRSEVSYLASDSITDAMKPLTDEERRNWAGWVELESDPALFNFILREYGIKDVKVQEVLGLETSLLAMLPQPVYGLIFLFKYWDDEEEEEEQTSKCPKHVWFANQTINNACATIALLNIVMNVPEIDLGEALSKFKAESRNLKPPYRGQMLGCDAFIRSIHNSFARRMDMLNADLALANEMKKWNRAKKIKRKSTNKTKRDESEPGFHFIAYVPVDGAVWKLDGLRRQPDNLGPYQQEDWMAVAIPNINQHLYQYEQDGVQFNLLSLCRSPLSSVPEKIAEIVHAFASLKELLTKVQPDWQQFTEVDESALVKGPSSSFGVSQELLDSSHISNTTRQRLEAAGTDVAALMDLYQEWARDQMQLQVSHMDEVALIEQENEQANRRKHDYTSVIYNSIKTLSEEGVLKEIVEDVCDKGGKDTMS